MLKRDLRSTDIISASIVAGAVGVLLTLAAAQQDALATPWRALASVDAPLVDALPLTAFVMPPAAALPDEAFEGRLRLRAPLDATSFEVSRDEFAIAADARLAVRTLPPFDFEFVTDGHHLIPVRRGTVRSEHPAWEWVIEPGHVWRTADANAPVRGTLPFALMERNANCVHYGVLAIELRAAATDSRAYWQISGETCAYFAFDARGYAALEVESYPVPSADAIREAWRQERAARLPTRPIEALNTVVARADSDDFGHPDDVAPADVTLFGVVVDGVHYAGGCQTRAGPHPYCETLPLPSYSLAKSLFAALALARLEERFRGAAETTIASLVPACDAASWGEVTLRDALDMATGRYEVPGADADEDAAFASPLFLAEDHESRIGYACGAYRSLAAPGTTFAYHTSDTYVAVTAMSELLRREAGDALDLYRDLIVRDLWRPLGLSPVTYETRRTRDAAAQPFGGWGLLFQRDDLARVGAWLMSEDHEIEGRRLLDRNLIRRALQRDGTGSGLETGVAGLRYASGFWALDVSRFLECERPVWVPFMAGYGGIVVTLFPNGVLYYHVSDGRSQRWRHAIRGADRVRPLCAARASGK